MAYYTVRCRYKPARCGRSIVRRRDNSTCYHISQEWAELSPPRNKSLLQNIEITKVLLNAQNKFGIAVERRRTLFQLFPVLKTRQLYNSSLWHVRYSIIKRDLHADASAA